MVEAKILARVISLPEASERRKLMAEQMGQAGLEWAFFDACRGSSPSMQIDEQSWIKSVGRTPGGGELGCYASHLTLLEEHGRRADDDILVVIEDDAILDTDYLRDQALFGPIVRRFGYVRLQGHRFSPATTVMYEGQRRVVRFHHRVEGTLGYCIDAPTARYLAEWLKVSRRPIDLELDRYWAHGVPIYCFYPFVAMERATPTQILQRDAPPSPSLSARLHRRLERQRAKLAQARYRIFGEPR